MEFRDKTRGPISPPVGRSAEIHETLSAIYPGDACRFSGNSFGASTSDLWVNNPRDAWAVGASTHHWNGTRWTRASVPSGRTLSGVWGVATNDVWAVGSEGTIVHYDGTRWSSIASPTTRELYAVWGSSSNDVWAAGAETILHWNGTSWTQNGGFGGQYFNRIWGASSNDVWAVGENALNHWNGASWTYLRPPVSNTATYRLESVWGSSGNDVWAVGFTHMECEPGVCFSISGDARPVGGTPSVDANSAVAPAGATPSKSLVLRWNGSTWTNVATPCVLSGGSYPRGTECGFTSITGSASNDVWAAGGTNPASGNSLFHWNGSSWSGIPGPRLAKLVTTSRGLWGVSSDQGLIWQKMDIPWVNILSATTSVNAASAPDATQVFGFQSDNQVLQWNGATRTTVPSNSPGQILASWARGKNDVWAVGNAGAAVHFNGSGWASYATGTTLALRGVGGGLTGDVWAVGDAGTIRRFDGNTWTGENSGVTADLRAVWASGWSDAWAAGNSSTMLHWDGYTWSSVPTGTSNSRFTGLWGSGPSDVWAVGGNGLLLHWDGSRWRSVQSGVDGPADLGSDFTGITGTGPNDVTAVTRNTVVHFDGHTWSRVGNAEAEQFTGIASGATSGIWISNGRGSLGQFSSTW